MTAKEAQLSRALMWIVCRVQEYQTMFCTSICPHLETEVKNAQCDVDGCRYPGPKMPCAKVLYNAALEGADHLDAKMLDHITKVYGEVPTASEAIDTS